MAFLLHVGKIVAEPSGAVAPAAALWSQQDFGPGPIAVVVSGGNVEPALLAEVAGAAAEAPAQALV